MQVAWPCIIKKKLSGNIYSCHYRRILILLSFRAKQGIFRKKASQVFILLRPSYHFPKVIETIFLFPSKVKFGEVNILIVRWTDCALSVVKIEKNSEFGLQN